MGVAERRDGHRCEKRGTLANIGQEQEEQVKGSRPALTVEKDDTKVTHSDKMHGAIHEDVYAKASVDYCRNASPQPVRKAGTDVDFYNVPTYQLLCLLELNNELRFGWMHKRR